MYYSPNTSLKENISHKNKVSQQQEKPFPFVGSESLPSTLVSYTNTDIFLTISNPPCITDCTFKNLNKNNLLPNDIPKGTLEYLHRQNYILTRAHNEIEQLEEWVVVLLMLSDLTQDKEESYRFAQTAYEQSKQLSTQYIHGSICRLAIKEFERHKELVGEPTFEKLVHEALEVSSKSKDLVASLCSCASVFYWVYLRTGQYGSLAEEYCLKASLFNVKYEDYLIEIQEKLYDLSEFEYLQKTAYKNVMFGLKDKIAEKYIRMLQKKLRQKNKANSGNQIEVNRFLEELNIWQNINRNEVNNVETFILENQKWNDKSVNHLLISSDGNLYVIVRLLEEYYIIGNYLSPETQFHLNYLFVKYSLRLVKSGLSFVDVDDIINLPYHFHYLATHYSDNKDSFMAMITLLEFKKLALYLLESSMLQNNPVARANWYFICIRALERVLEMYPNHVLSTHWKSEIEQLRITKSEIDSTLVFNDWGKDEKDVEPSCTESIIVVSSTDPEEVTDWGN